MASDKTLLYFGALLHDVGKVVYRGSSARGTHSKLGADFVSDEVASLNDDFAGTDGRRIVEQIRYHHAKELKAAPSLPGNSLAYITYFADNVSAGMDRKNEGDEAQAASFDRTVKLRKIFNILNGHNDDNTVEHEDYNVIRERIKEGLAGTKVSPREVNSLLNLLEATTSTVPSSTNLSELVDVSLYDHAKTTAGLAACIYEYLAEKGVSDYRQALFDQARSPEYYDRPMFLLYSCDMSGIQDFIYNISGSGALKQLRARSLYLEMLLEHVVDELLDRLELCRANLLYTGGGHAYLLLPNTARTKAELQSFADELGGWFVDRYRTDLYLASAWVACSANDLANEGANKDRYPNLYRDLTRKLSAAKAARYSAATIRELNFAPEGAFDHSRECTECHRSDLHINSEGKCPLCAALGDISRDLVDKDVFVVETSDGSDGKHPGLDLPFGCRLSMYSRKGYLDKRPEARRVYTKNSWDMGIGLATHIWMGDYTAPTDGEGIAAYARRGTTIPDEHPGIERLGVLRADVDNLGATFVSGLPRSKVSISRTSTLSRALSYFFKHEVNQILERSSYQAQIIYSGGDDLFIVGNWNDVIYAAIDIRTELDRYTGNGSLTLSAGIGMFDAKYPIARMAAETGELEERAKLHRSEAGTEKNAVALWAEKNVFGWDELVQTIEPRMREVGHLFKKTEESDKGKALIYKIVALLRDFKGSPSMPRLAYLLARSFEGDGDRGTAACQKLHGWAREGSERRRLTVALEWYVYTVREGR